MRYRLNRLNYFSRLIILFSLVGLFFAISSIPLKAQENQATITITPSTANLKLNDQKAIQVTITTQDNKPIAGFDLTFNTSLLEITDFIDQPGTGLRKSLEETNRQKSRIVYVSPQSNTQSTVTFFLQIKAHQSGIGSISLDTKNSQITATDGSFFTIPSFESKISIGNATSANFVSPPPLSAVSIPENSALVSFRLKLLGITSQSPQKKSIPATVVIVGRVGEDKFETPLQTIDLTPNQNAIFSGSILIPNFKDGNKFSILIKPQNYLLKRICDTNPTETKAGQYKCTEPTLTIQEGQTNFDFSNIQLLPGDLGVIDSILNGYDLSLIQNNFSKTDSKNISTTDLNFDNKIDQKDLDLLIYTLSNTSGEDDK